MKKKVDYSLPIEASAYDACRCCSDCAAACGRKNPPVERYFTACDFSKDCSKYVKFKND